MKNFEYCAYTYRHRKAVMYLVNKMIKDDDLKKIMIDRAMKHDMDKILMYQIYERSDVSTFHKAHSQHHMSNNLEKSYYDMLESVLDYESSAYTKPDKPLNAFDTINKFKRIKKIPDSIADNMLMICADYGINSSYSVTEDKEGMAEMAKYETVTEDDIYKEIEDYFKYLRGE